MSQSIISILRFKRLPDLFFYWHLVLRVLEEEKEKYKNFFLVRQKQHPLEQSFVKSHIGYSKFSNSHIKKIRTNEVGLNNMLYLMQHIQKTSACNHFNNNY